MATFTLTSGTNTFVFDTSGNGAVTRNGVAFGQWSTNERNQLVVRPAQTGAPAQAFDVKWQFNDKNELCLSSGTQLLCNFHDDRRPRYDLAHAVLKVKPDVFGEQQFELRGEWDLREQDMKLEFTMPDGAKSTLDGTLSDLRSRFAYHIASKTAGREDHTAILVFVGRWGKDPNDSTKLNFLYLRENNTEDVFKLPGDLEFSPGTNQIVYKFGGGLHKVQIVGRVRVSPTFQITYSVGSQFSSGGATQVGASDIVIDAVFANASFEGGLQLAVRRPAGGETIYRISGQFTHVRQSGTRIGVGFSISGGTGTTPVVVGFRGTFDIANNGKVFFSFEGNAKNNTIEFGVDQIRLGGSTASASASIVTKDGKLAGVEVMFGFQFPLVAIGNAVS